VNGSGFKIELPQWNFSPEVDLPDGDLNVAVLSTLPPKGEPIPLSTPTIKIPDSWSRCLLIFLPDPDNKVFPAKIIPVNASAAEFPNGYTKIYNLTGATILGKFGSESVKVLPRKSASFKPPTSQFGPYLVAIDCVLPGEEKLSGICCSSWMHNPDVRQIMFVTPSEGYKVPRIWGILDHEVPVKTDKAKE
jgi:hypothetical protein